MCIRDSSYISASRLCAAVHQCPRTTLRNKVEKQRQLSSQLDNKLTAIILGFRPSLLRWSLDNPGLTIAERMRKTTAKTLQRLPVLLVSGIVVTLLGSFILAHITTLGNQRLASLSFYPAPY